MQRLFDIIFSGIALIFASPLLLPLIIILKITGEGEIFFLQKRVGKNEISFNLLKFATMLKDSPNLGTGTVTIHNDPRVLPIGRFLRKTKINELPQLVNIFRGDMSIIGPRPQTRRCFDAFPTKSKNEIIKVKPGLSGIGSVIFRNEEIIMENSNDPDRFYDEIVMPYKGSLEEWYVTNHTIKSYFFLIIITVWIVFTSNSSIVWKLFKDLPIPPDELKDLLR
jgi:lipopolysaccharide/colanic/teichoic acid biosynthesis glycosyltransferase